MNHVAVARMLTHNSALTQLALSFSLPRSLAGSFVRLLADVAAAPHATNARTTQQRARGYVPSAAEALLCAALQHNITLLAVAGTGAPTLDTAATRAVLRNRELVWPRLHALIVDVVVALAPLRLSSFVLLWIVDALPCVARVRSAAQRLRVVDRVVASINRVKK